MWWQKEIDPYSQYYTSSGEKSREGFISLKKVIISLVILCAVLLMKKVNFPLSSMVLTRVNQALTYEMDLTKLQDTIKNFNLLKEELPAFKSIIRDEAPKLSSSGMIAPVHGKVTSRFGQRFHPLLKVERMHNGIDIEQVEGTPVKAAGDGTVMLAAEDAELGRIVKIRHDGDVVTVYAHLKDVYVKIGDKVNQGQIIGTVGKTGLAEKPHLHFEIWEKGVAVNPEKWLKIPEKP
ncbi:MAG: M23 family metallopeptidase [Thermosediminibacteraceae bacterium]|nr:M23 family metallopeptidase [Thermosediminibacteraceae bacterium]